MLVFIFAAAQAAVPLVQCRFDASTMQFSGSPSDQARCLLHPIGVGGEQKAEVPLPPLLVRLIGTTVQIDTAKLTVALRRARIPLPATTPVSETSDHLRAVYFVIHDTSSPFLRSRTFPRDANIQPRFNDVRQFLGKDAVAHLFNDRRGRVTVGHELEVGWRATKLESAIGDVTRGRFLHVENVQARRTDPAGPAGNDHIAPVPGFTRRQYRTLALLYVLASTRAGAWMIPAFHANIDRGIPNAHDDPQNFDLGRFSTNVNGWLQRLGVDH